MSQRGQGTPHERTHGAFSTYAEAVWSNLERSPDATAFVFLADDGSESAVTYSELYRAARGVVDVVRPTAPERVEPVLLLVPPGATYVAGLFACLLSGVPAVPAFPPDLFQLDRSLPRIAAILKDSTARVVLTTEPLASLCADLIRELAGNEQLEFVIADALGPSSDPLEALPDPSTPALLQYTSGSTSLPRGVMVTQANLAANCEFIRRALELRADTVCVSWLPPYHDMGLVGQILAPAFAGFRAVLMSPTMFIRRPVEWLRAITRHRADLAGGPNFAYDLCARRVKPEHLAELDLSCWELAFSGAEPVRAETLDAFERAFGEAGFRRRAFYPCYGLAEATLLVTGGTRSGEPRILEVDRTMLARHDRAVPAGGDSCRSLVGVGSTAPDHELAIVDADSRRRLPDGEVGEIWVAGPSVAAGYWDREDETAESFEAFTEDGAGPFLRTGDLGFTNDGELFVTGRIKDVIVVNGQNVYPTDVERACERAVKGLRPGCGAAFGLSSDGGSERLGVVYELRRTEKDPSKVIDGVRRAVSMEVKLEPEAIVLIEPHSITKTSSGKVQRWLARQEYLDDRLAKVAAWSRSANEQTRRVAAQGASRWS